METLPFTVAFLLAVATLGSSQMPGGPGTEPWAFVAQVACQMKKIDLTAATGSATSCVMQLTAGDPNPMAICGKKKQRNDCLKPYYDELKKCFDGDAKKDVDKAFKAQKEGVNFMCADNGKKFTSNPKKDVEKAFQVQKEGINFMHADNEKRFTSKCQLAYNAKKDVDKAFQSQKHGINFKWGDNQKRFTGLKPEDTQCQQKTDPSCMQDVMKESMPNPSRLFDSKNCKAMHGIVECGVKSFEHCKTTGMKDLVVGQMNSVLGETPCGEANGASTFSVFATPILIFALLCHGVMKALF